MVLVSMDCLFLLFVILYSLFSLLQREERPGASRTGTAGEGALRARAQGQGGARTHGPPGRRGRQPTLSALHGDGQKGNAKFSFLPKLVMVPEWLGMVKRMHWFTFEWHLMV